ncbi:hypothetical protein ACJJIX_06735 [Microbulbifer sp. VAAC004]|uniref:hypothetical protein n=1 Tax=unclassified Microbulbifer TaxID=2619833 RepID=UPI0040397C67
MLDSQLKNTSIKKYTVPISFQGSGGERGFFDLPPNGMLVEIVWSNVSPERPFVRSVLGEHQALPWMDELSMPWQQSEDVKQSVDASGK